MRRETAELKSQIQDKERMIREN